jgi:hypothetical protein
MNNKNFNEMVQRSIDKAMEKIRLLSQQRQFPVNADFGSGGLPSLNDGISNYKRDTFFDTSCHEAKVYNYREMYSLLQQLSDQYDEVKLTSCGKSEGYGGPEYALDVWSLHILPTEEPISVDFFVGGQHICENSGSVTAYMIGMRLLESFKAGNPHVHKMRKNSHIVIIPQVDVDYYNNLERYPTLPKNYWETGYGIFTATDGEISIQFPKNFNANFYGSVETHLELQGYPPMKQSQAVKKTIENLVFQKGLHPFLGIDYHEAGLGRKFTVFFTKYNPKADSFTKKTPLYILRAVRPFYPVEFIQCSEDSDIAFVDEKLLSGFLTKLGADSFVFEPPDKDKGYKLEQQIEMNLIATDRILAEYYMDM